MAAGVPAYLIGVPFLDLVEPKTIDLRFKARDFIRPGPEVVLAVIDEKSIAKEGKWIWPRSKIAGLVTKISDAGARVIGFDIGFLEPVEKISKEVKRLKIEQVDRVRFLDRLRQKKDDDQLLAIAIKNAECEVVSGYFFQMDKSCFGAYGRGRNPKEPGKLCRIRL